MFTIVAPSLILMGFADACRDGLAWTLLPESLSVFETCPSCNIHLVTKITRCTIGQNDNGENGEHKPDVTNGVLARHYADIFHDDADTLQKKILNCNVFKATQKHSLLLERRTPFKVSHLWLCDFKMT